MIGLRVGRYEIVGKLGEGGMGVVYLAEDISLPRKVALKFLPERLRSDEAARKRFLREAESAAVLDHPYICNIKEVARTEDGRDYIVMEFVEGRTLREHLEQGPPALKKALQVGVEIAEALEVAHTKGIIHRDLKPANIILTPQGHVKIMDFGLAKRTLPEQGNDEDLTSALTREGSILGTPAYMSPEQIRAQEVDQRSDIFSYGIVLYEMVTGVHPFRKAQPIETTSAILGEDPSPPERYRNDLPELLRHTLRKMLAKNRDQRYQSVHEVRTNLEEIREQYGLQTGGEAAKRRTGTRSPWLTRSLAPLILIAVAVVYWAVGPSPGPGRPEPATLHVVPFTALPGLEEFPDFSPEGGRIVYSRQEPGKAPDLFVQQLGPGNPYQLTQDDYYERFPRWSPDGQVIAFARFLPERQKVAIVTVPALGGTETTLTEVSLSRGREPTDDYGVTGISWAPDGQHLAVSFRPEGEDEARVFRWGLKTATLEPITSPPDGILGDFQAVFSPDGSRIAFFRRLEYARWFLYLQPLSVDVPKLLTPGSFQNACGLTWSPNGKEIVFSAGPRQKESLWSLGVSDGALVKLSGLGESMSKRWPSSSPDGNRLAFSEMPASNFDIWRIERPELNPQPLVASTRWDGRPRFSPDGERLVFCSDRTGFVEIYTCAKEGSKILQVTDLRAECGSPTWSPDGLRIAFDSTADGNSDLYVIVPGTGAPSRIAGDPAEDAMPSWSRDGRHLYYHSNRSGEFQIWKANLDTGEQVQITRNGGWYAQESSDGRFVYFQKSDIGKLWRMPEGGGAEVLVLDTPIHSWSWAVTPGGIYFLSREQRAESWSMKVRHLDFSSDDIREVFTVQVPERPVGLTVSPNQHEFVFGLTFANDNSDIMLMDQFR